MIYRPDWEPLSDALKRVVEAGIDEEQAKTALCHAIADRKIRLRVTVDSADSSVGGKTLSGGNLDAPVHLSASDLDWDRSRPYKPWRVGPDLVEHYHATWGWAARAISLVELFASDVVALLRQRVKPALTDDDEQTKHQEGRRRGRKPEKLEGTKAAMRRDIDEGKYTQVDLRNMLEKALADSYNVSRDTARKARKAVLSEIVARQISTNDK
jgi:hypothetical protein